MSRGKHSANAGSDFFSHRSTRREEKVEEIQEEQETEDINQDYYEEEYEDERISKVRVICAIALVIAVVIIAIIIVWNPKKEEETPSVAQPVVQEITYNEIGKIKINKIDVEQSILDSRDEKALEKGVIKLYGTSLNNYGNLCLAGHNYDSVFGKLNELDMGDSIILIDNSGSENEYIVKEILEVEPTNLEVLLSDETKVELTLITCTNLSTKRLVIKAEEKGV